MRGSDASTVLNAVIPCGQCWGCKLERSRQWAVRCVHEAATHLDPDTGRENTCFITLTYDDDHWPDWGSLQLRDWQLFAKTWRNQIGKFRYMMCGEYGDQFGRPHYHAIIFGEDLKDDRKYLKTNRGNRLDTSASLDRCWDKGFATVGDVTFESCAYVSRYVMKKITGEKAMEHYFAGVDITTGECHMRKPEFNTMSKKPGLGSEWLKRWGSDVYPRDLMMMNGKEIRPPKYYDDQFEMREEDVMRLVKEKRRRVVDGIDLKEITRKRLRAKEEISRAKSVLYANREVS